MFIRIGQQLGSYEITSLIGKVDMGEVVVRQILRVSIVFSLIVGCLCQLQAQLDPLIGVWALDLSKSIYEPGPPPLRLSTTYRKTTEGYAFVSEGLDAQGRPFKV